jgi:hypothetical protein
VQIVISDAFNNKSVHFVGVIIVWLSTCTEGQQLKLYILLFTAVFSEELKFSCRTLNDTALFHIVPFHHIQYTLHLSRWHLTSELQASLLNDFRTNAHVGSNWEKRRQQEFNVKVIRFVSLYYITPCCRFNESNFRAISWCNPLRLLYPNTIWSYSPECLNFWNCICWSSFLMSWRPSVNNNDNTNFWFSKYFVFACIQLQMKLTLLSMGQKLKSLVSAEGRFQKYKFCYQSYLFANEWRSDCLKKILKFTLNSSDMFRCSHTIFRELIIRPC